MTTESTPAKVRFSDGLGHTPLTDACLLDRDDVVVCSTNGGGVHVASVRQIERTLRAEIERLRAALHPCEEWFSSIDDTLGTQDKIDAVRTSARDVLRPNARLTGPKRPTQEYENGTK